jgi:predicted RNA-binding protein with PUA domain
MTDENQSQEITEEQKKKLQAEIQKQFNMFKKRFKVKSKSELVAIIWEQGIEFRKLQDIAQELYEENRALKGEKNEESSSEDNR